MAIADTRTSRDCISEEHLAAIDEFLRLRGWYDRKLAKLNERFPNSSLYLMDVQGALSCAEVSYACQMRSDQAWKRVQSGLEAAETAINNALSSLR